MFMLKLRQVASTTGKGRSAIYADIKNGLFTKAVRLGAKAVAWPSSEVETILDARVAGYTDCQLRELISKLHSARTKIAHRLPRTDSIDGGAA